MIAFYVHDRVTNGDVILQLLRFSGTSRNGKFWTTVQLGTKWISINYILL